jgi:hypothetical protein
MSRFQDPPARTPLVREDRAATEEFQRWLLSVAGALSGGVTATIPLAKITSGGTDGALVVRNGLIVQITQPT